MKISRHWCSGSGSSSILPNRNENIRVCGCLSSPCVGSSHCHNFNLMKYDYLCSGLYVFIFHFAISRTHTHTSKKANEKSCYARIRPLISNSHVFWGILSTQNGHIFIFIHICAGHTTKYTKKAHKAQSTSNKKSVIFSLFLPFGWSVRSRCVHCVFQFSHHSGRFALRKIIHKSFVKIRWSSARFHYR